MIGAREVFFAVLATTATLVSVFVPISFLPSAAGRLFTEFGFVMAFAVLISSFVALSLAPMMASRIDIVAAPGRVAAALGRARQPAPRALYDRALAALLRHRALVLVAALACAAGGRGGAARPRPGTGAGRGPRRADACCCTGPDGTGLAYTDRQIEQALRRCSRWSTRGW